MRFWQADSLEARCSRSDADASPASRARTALSMPFEPNVVRGIEALNHAAVQVAVHRLATMNPEIRTPPHDLLGMLPVVHRSAHDRRAAPRIGR